MFKLVYARGVLKDLRKIAPSNLKISFGGNVMKYKVSLKKTEEGYAVWVPGLPGCWSQGETEEEAVENIKDAIEGYLAAVQELTKGAECRYVEVINA